MLYSDDINKCISSAKKGFKIWSTKSITCRMQVLSKLAYMLECNGYVCKVLKTFLFISILICVSAFNCSQ